MMERSVDHARGPTYMYVLHHDDEDCKVLHTLHTVRHQATTLNTAMYTATD
jgi:hypothetical protein